MKPIVNLIKLGRLPYSDALIIQETIFEKLKNSVVINKQRTTSDITFKFSRSNYLSSATTTENSFNNVGNSLLLVEHEPVYTIGLRARQYNDAYVIKLKDELDKHNMKADFVRTSRGGLITFHGPGQMVAYPIIHLGDFKDKIENKSIRNYVNLLERTIIDTLARVGLEGAHTIKEYPGVWLGNGERKIAFIGISCKRFVTMHGVSINCNCDLSWFNHIISCGIEDKQITSVSNEASLLAKHQFERKYPSPTTSIAEITTTTSSKSASLFSLKSNGTSHYQLSNNNLLSDDKFNVDEISNAFCSSFSLHFNCILKETNPNISNLRNF